MKRRRKSTAQCLEITQKTLIEAVKNLVLEQCASPVYFVDSF